MAEHGGTFCRDMSQRHVAATKPLMYTLRGYQVGTCSWGKIKAISRTRKCCGEMSQGRVAATRPLVSVLVDTLIFVQHESYHNFFPATCRTKFNLLNLLGHFARTKLSEDTMFFRVHGCATCSCNRIHQSQKMTRILQAQSIMGRFVVDIKYHRNVGWPLIREISA